MENKFCIRIFHYYFEKYDNVIETKKSLLGFFME